MVKTDDISPENYLTLREVAEKTGLAYRTVEVYVTLGKIKCERIRFMGMKRRLVTVEQLEDFLRTPRRVGNPTFWKEPKNARHLDQQ